jgi:hypothetical protein
LTAGTDRNLNEEQQMHFVSRKFVCERLKVSRKTAYQMFPKPARSPIPDAVILRKLNAAAVGIKPVSMIPSNLLTADEACQRLLIDGVPIRRDRLLRWASSVPHYRLSSHCLRFPADLFDAWVAARRLK